MNRSIFLVLIAVAVGTAIFWRFHVPEALGGNGSGDTLVEVTVPQLSTEAMAGEAGFNEKCVDCHGENAAGRKSAGPALVHKIYEPSLLSDDAFRIAVRHGVRAHHWPFGDMMPVENVSDEQIEQIIDYVRTLQRANGIQ